MIVNLDCCLFKAESVEYRKWSLLASNNGLYNRHAETLADAGFYDTGIVPWNTHILIMYMYIIILPIPLYMRSDSLKFVCDESLNYLLGKIMGIYLTFREHLEEST